MDSAKLNALKAGVDFGPGRPDPFTRGRNKYTKMRLEDTINSKEI